MELSTLKMQRHKAGWAFVPVHASHDPDKGTGWIVQERAKYPRQEDFEREIGIDFRVVSGMLAYLSWSDALHIEPGIGVIPQLPLCLCCDFNVSPMVWLVAQIWRGILRVLDEMVLDPASVPNMATEFRNRYPSHTSELWIYGDASGTTRSAQTAMSDYDLLRLGLRGYPVPIIWKIQAANPPVKDRLAAVNQRLRDSEGRAWIRVSDRCPMLVQDMHEVVLDRQGTGIYKTFDPKNPYSKRTHASDGLGYLITREWPVVSEVYRYETRARAPRKYGRVLGAV